MAIEYQFLDRSDETLIEVSELPVEEGIAVAVRTTGYEIGADEIVEISIVDFEGAELLSRVVKPQNIENWTDAEASGGIMPSDVAEAPELFQFEDEIRDLFEKASIVVGQHIDFVREMIEASWVALPDFKGYDLIAEFCASHSSIDYPDQPAAIATLSGVAGYYDALDDESSTVAIARTVSECYQNLVKEHAQVRIDKGPEYWQRYNERLEEARRADAQQQAANRGREARSAGINALLWLCAAAIFSNLAVQIHLRGVDFGFVAVAAVAAVFAVVRWIMGLYTMHKLRKK
ncbi:MAG: hypothetical protein IJ087_01200 [Eggerthellaceae bacterium]|nr:hypothetical protein [Eggerthellaceae bacterium]